MSCIAWKSWAGSDSTASNTPKIFKINDVLQSTPLDKQDSLTTRKNATGVHVYAAVCYCMAFRPNR